MPHFQSLVLILLGSILPFTGQVNLSSSCNLTVDAGPDILICEGETGMLNGSISGNYDDFEWTPPTGLGSPFDLNTTVSVSGPTIYKLTARGTGSDLIINGDFETGSIAPGVSNFVNVNPPLDIITSGGGSYTIAPEHVIATGFGCTPFSGTYALVYNGQGAGGVNIYCQTVSVTPNTDYKFEAWLMNTAIPFFTTSPSISISVNGTTIASHTAAGALCQWSNVTATWNSGGSTSANVCIVNANAGTNFGVLDDISFVECCYAEDEVLVDVVDVRALINPAGPITCDNPMIVLDASGSSSGPGYTYEWTTSNGVILSGGNTLNPVIGAPGTYTLMVTGPNNCEDEVSITIEGSVTQPDVRTFNAILTCTNSPVLVAASSSNPDVDYFWTGPNGFVSFDQSFSTDVPGTYLVKVEDAYKCFNYDSVVVLDQRNFPALTIIGDTISCGIDSVALSYSSTSWNLTYEWRGPNNFTSTDSTISVRDSGQYILTVLDSNDCSTSDTFVLIKTDLSFDIHAETDTITCDHPLATLRGYSDSSNVQFIWEGPNGFTGSGAIVQVSDSGQYILTAIYDSLCSVTDTIQVIKEDGVPDIFLFGDTINCLKDSVMLIGGSSTSGSTLRWTGPNSFSSLLSTITVRDSGTYTLIVTGLNGCEVEKSFTVQIDRLAPIFTLIPSDTLNCLRDSVHLIATGLTNSDHISWQGPAGFQSSEKGPMVGMSGTYVLEVIGKNGCFSTDSVVVVSDFDVPAVSDGRDTLTCATRSLTLDAGKVENGRWSWTGPNGYSSLVANPTVNIPGVYTVVVTGKNGCDTTVIVDVAVDTLSPVFKLIGDTLNCEQSHVELIVEGAASGDFQWTGPNNFSSDLRQPMVRDSGWYELTVTGGNGCSHMDSVFVFQTEQTPDIFVSGDTLSCLKDSVILYGRSNTPNVNFEWRNATGTLGFSDSLVVFNGGQYSFIVSTAAGCSTIQQVEVIVDTVSPHIISLTSLGLKCDSLFTNLTSTFDSTVIDFFWTGPGSFSSDDQNPRVSEIGWYYLTVIGANGCSDYDSIFLVAQDMKPDIYAVTDTLTCNRDTVTLIGSSSTPGVTYTWENPTGQLTSDSIYRTSTTGRYRLTVKDQNDCTSELTIEVVSNYARPEVILMADTLRCREIQATITAEVIPDASALIWTGPTGTVRDENMISTAIPGLYQLISTHPLTGCEDTAFIELIEDTDTINGIQFEVVHADCGNDKGSVLVTGVNGSQGPYLYQINNRQVASIPGSDLLDPGSYNLTVYDKFGCSFVQIVNIQQLPTYRIDLIDHLQIGPGDSAMIEVMTTLPDSLIQEITWVPTVGLSCSDCLSLFAGPSKTTTYTVTVIDKNGCRYTAEVRIEVLSRNHFYIPNSFSPNGDQLNDRLYVYGDESLVVEEMTIFDRWGEVVYRSGSGKANDASLGWDGSFHGEPVLPGVYVYAIVLSTAEGPKRIHGSVTLIR